MNYLRLPALALAVAAAVTACSSAAPASPGTTDDISSGTVVSATQVADLTPAEVAAQLSTAMINPSQVRHGVMAYRVVYRTVGVTGEPTTASQLVALPQSDTSDLRVVSWLHGTTVYRGDVASAKETSTDRAAALLLASTGQAVSAPDYLGLGESLGTHPYGSPEETVSAALDALRSARQLAATHHRTLDERVLVSGFSQGGPATMMVGRALQEEADPYFGLGGLAPIAGPFDLSTFEADAANDKIDNAALYLSYFVVAWNRLYGLYSSPDEAFQQPYAAQVEALFDGDHTGQQIAAVLPSTSEELFTPDFLDKVRHPSGVLQEKLHALDTTCDWKPDVPVHLYHARGDTDVAFDNALFCQQQLSAHGAEHHLTDVGDVDHNTTVRRALPQVIQEFAAVS